MKCIILMMICLNAADDHTFFGEKAQHQLFCPCKIATFGNTARAIKCIEQKYTVLISLITLYRRAEKLAWTMFECHEISMAFGKFSLKRSAIIDVNTGLDNFYWRFF